MVKLSEEVARALGACDGEPLQVEVPGCDRRYMLVEGELAQAAIAALQHQRNVEAIRVGIREMDEGLGRPLDEAMDDIRRSLLMRESSDETRHPSASR